MDLALKQRFADEWHEFFGDAPLPLALWYARGGEGPDLPPPKKHHCFIAQLSAVMAGAAARFRDADVLCPGGRRYLGFSQTVPPTLPEFLSTGVPGGRPGERYRATPQQAAEWIGSLPAFPRAGRELCARRWDQLEAGDEPELVVFFATPDVLSGLFTLANYDRGDAEGVVCPSTAGCGAVVMAPSLEADSPRPRAVLGLFDPSARPHVPAGTLSFVFPWSRFVTLSGCMRESFLSTGAWQRVLRRMEGGTATGQGPAD